MHNPLTYGFANLFRFSGRDRRNRFWPHAAIVFAISTAVSMVAMPIAMAPVMAKMMTYAAENPESTQMTYGPGHASVSIDAGAPNMPVIDPTPMVAVMGLCVLVTVILLAAAVARRLHDRGIAGYWGLTPVVFLTAGLFLMPRLMTNFAGPAEPDMGLFGLLFANNALYMVTLIGLIVLLALPGQPGANRYGEPPAP